jgi:hypothetical protein
MLRDPPVTRAIYRVSFLIMIMLLCESVTNTQLAALYKSASPSTTAPAPKGGWLSTPNGLALQLHPHGHLSERLLLAAFQVSSTIASTNFDTSGAITKITIKTIGQASKNPFTQ